MRAACQQNEGAGGLFGCSSLSALPSRNAPLASQRRAEQAEGSGGSGNKGRAAADQMGGSRNGECHTMGAVLELPPLSRPRSPHTHPHWGSSGPCLTS